MEEEAFWLVFLSVHFGEHHKSKWNLLKTFYSGLNEGTWSWSKVTKANTNIRQWIDDNQETLRASGTFGNHRKYESLSAWTNSGLGEVILSYLEYIQHYGSHDKWKTKLSDGPKDSFQLFNDFYQNLKIHRFGRTAKFDLLCLLGKFDLLPIEPGSIYLNGATGPFRGSGLLFEGTTKPQKSRKELEIMTYHLNEYLKLDFGMQVLEDALCNWQKKPSQYIHYK